MDLVQAIAAGMKDSVSPCALTTASFFTFALLIFGKTRYAVATFGGYFLAGCFVFNLAILFGWTDFFLGTFRAQNILRAVQPFLGYVLIILGGVHLYDWWNLKVGQGNRRAVIPYLSQPEHRGNMFKLFAVVSGMALTVVQSIWPPDYSLVTLFYHSILPGKFLTAVIGMAVYTFFLMLPMMFVFGFFHAAAQNNSLGMILNKQTAMIKIVLAGFFVSLGIGLIQMFS